jgi:SAM-dependent methyltransferase
MKSKTIYKILLNRQVLEHCREMSGDVLDLAGGGNPSYKKYLPEDINYVGSDLNAHGEAKQQIDINKPLPFVENSFDNILFFNAIYIVEESVSVLKEIKRILKPGGKLFIASPFIANEMPEPHDYCRFTAEGLERELKRAGFSDFKIIRFGERFTSAVYLLHKFFLFDFIRFFIYGFAIILDKIIPAGIKKNHPAPLGYFCIVWKTEKK